MTIMGEDRVGRELPKVLIVGQTPPPWHGQAVATKMLFEHRWTRFEGHCLRMAFSEEMDHVGRFRLAKITHLLRLIKETRAFLKRHPGSILFYPPASARWVPFLRDVIYLATTRHLAAGTVFIFHARGLAKFVTGTHLRRFLGRLAYDQADLALEVSLEDPAPGDVFHAARSVWCPCAADVPTTVADGVKDRNLGPLNLLFVGSLQEGKGVLEVLKTAECLKRLGLEGEVRIRIAGRWFSDGFRDQALSLLDELGVQEIVEFVGEVVGDAKWRLYSEADVFFFPTHYHSEATPIVIMEALGSGLVILSTEWSGIPAMLEGCSTATLLPIRSPERYADAVKEMVENRSRIGEKSKDSRRYYEAHYTPSSFLNRVEHSISGIRCAPGREKRPPEVMQVFNRYSSKGGEEVWVDAMPLFVREGANMRLLDFQSSAWKSRGAPARLRQARWIWNNPTSRNRLREEFRKRPFDVLICHNLIPVASLGIYREAARLGVPVIQYVHNFRPFSPSGTLWVRGQIKDGALNGRVLPEVLAGSWENSRIKTAILAHYLRKFVRDGGLEQISRWVAVSDFMRSKLIEAGVPEDRIVTLRHCWQATPNLVRQQDRSHYLFLGRLVEEKGVLSLLDAWQALEGKLGSACPDLVIAGTGPLERAVRIAAERSTRVRYVGHVDGEEKRAWVRSARAIVAPSLWWEPLGLIVYEAFDQERPVIAARSGGLVETVSASGGGLLHPPGDVGALVSAVQGLESMGEEGRRELGARGRDWLIQEADPEEWRVKFLELLAAVRLEGQ